jgi:hypothetical protein
MLYLAILLNLSKLILVEDVDVIYDTKFLGLL